MCGESGGFAGECFAPETAIQRFDVAPGIHPVGQNDHERVWLRLVVLKTMICMEVSNEVTGVPTIRV